MCLCINSDVVYILTHAHLPKLDMRAHAPIFCTRAYFLHTQNAFAIEFAGSYSNFELFKIFFIKSKFSLPAHDELQTAILLFREHAGMRADSVLQCVAGCVCMGVCVYGNDSRTGERVNSDTIL